MQTKLNNNLFSDYKDKNNIDESLTWIEDGIEQNEDCHAERMFLQKFDRILDSDTNISVDVINKLGTIADVNMAKKIISINFKHCIGRSGNYPNFIKTIKGLNFHEMAHLNFTAKPKNFNYQFETNNHKMIFNIMEDCRVENLFCLRYPISRNYFAYNFLNFIQSKQPKKDQTNPRLLARSLIINYLLGYGRKFSDRKNVARAKELAIKTLELLDISLNFKKINSIMDSFIKCNDFNSQKIFVSMMYEQLKPLFENSVLSQYSYDFGTETSQETNSGQKGRQRDADKLKDGLSDMMEQFNKGLKKEDKTKESDNQSSKTQEEKNKIRDECEKEIAESLSESIEEINNQVEEQVNDDISEIEKIKGASSGSLEIEGGETAKITSQDKINVAKVSNLIKRLRTDLGQHYSRKQKSGLVNIRDIIQNKHREIERIDVFRKYKHDKINRTRIGTVIIVDSSGSMKNSDYILALRSAYCISSALEKTDSKSCIIAFSSGDFITIKPFNKLSNNMNFTRKLGGGTDPTPSFNFSEHELEKLKKNEGIRNLAVVLISDLHFDKSDLNGENLHNINKFGMSLKNSLERISKKFSLITFQIQTESFYYGFSCPEIEKASRHFSKVRSYEHLYGAVNKWVKKFEMDIHSKIMRGMI